MKQILESDLLDVLDNMDEYEILQEDDSLIDEEIAALFKNIANINPLSEDMISRDGITNTGLYEFAFCLMYNHVKESKSKYEMILANKYGVEEPILRLEDRSTELHAAVVADSEHYLLNETANLIMRLFTLYEIDYISYDSWFSHQRNLPFYRLEGGKKIGYMFSNSITYFPEIERIKAETGLDGIKIIAFIENGRDSILRNLHIEANVKKSEGFLQYWTLRDLFSMISKDEYSTYLSYVEKFNCDIKNLIGYITADLPEGRSLEKLKYHICQTFIIFPYKSYLKELDNKQIAIMDSNFRDKQLYRFIFGNTSFAESFISSEWHYINSAAFGELEKTAIVVGYLKSVEQLLFSIIKLSINTGKTIKTRRKGQLKSIQFSSNNINDIDRTLGSLTNYVKKYPELWSVNEQMRNYIINKLNEYRPIYRNGVDTQPSWL